ncbi:UDP-N-acetylenolpyruvoylglucosamine reductase [subsurface metagenome]
MQNRVLFNEPMSSHTSFRIGGPADVFITPQNLKELKKIYNLCLNEELPFFLLGEGANSLVSDRGIRGIVIDLSLFSGSFFEPEKELFGAHCGMAISQTSLEARHFALSGLEFVYSMPGSVGGSIRMNARCYGFSVSDILAEVELLDDNLQLKRFRVFSEEFGYKKSPFQSGNLIILKGFFRLAPGNKEQIKAKMDQYKQDRTAKGHFLFPCAGSIFKNNRDFGRPTGKIIDSLGLKGYNIGGAEISKTHANLIVNTGKSKAADVLQLIEFIEEKVYAGFGYKLEREILLIGEWSN